MPYKSQAQRRFFHTDTARQKGIGPKTVNEFDQASTGLKLPETVNNTKAVAIAPPHNLLEPQNIRFQKLKNRLKGF